MKPGEEDTNAHELVLIRRRSGGEDAPHKGGVWKIAYADFMTAMMAFFLVMWLINSTDQRVLTQVANYFNPMRLTDSTPHTRGPNNIESGEQGKQGKQSSIGDPKEKNAAKEKAQDKDAGKGAAPKGDAKNDANATASPRYTEQALFSDPYGVLARIAAEADIDASPPTTKDASRTGDAYRDPFDPAGQRTSNKGTRPSETKAAAQTRDAGGSASQDKIHLEQDAKAASETIRKSETANLDSLAGGGARQPPDDVAAPRELSATVETKAPPNSQDATNATREAEHAKEAKQASDAKRAKEAKEAKEAATQQALQDEAATIESDLKRVAAQLKGTVPNMDVTVTEDGVLITLTDDYDFGMFAIASAEPRPAMVAIMERIAKILQNYQQPVTVRGHTDGRPYRSGTYDNWRLSTARAHMAYYMLVRGGVDDRRFERVEGYADRNLRVPGDPEAAQNRRIEILLRRPKP